MRFEQYIEIHENEVVLSNDESCITIPHQDNDERDNIVHALEEILASIVKNEKSNLRQEHKKETLIVYHDNCMGGLCAAWAFWDLPNATFVAALPGDAPPSTEGFERMYILDLYYTAGVVAELQDNVEVVLLAHHPAAKILNTTKSGAMLAWEYRLKNFANLGEGIPRIVEYVQDADLYAHTLEDTLPLNAAIKSFINTDFDIREHFNVLFSLERDIRMEPQALILEGQAILREQELLIGTLLKKATKVVNLFDGYTTLAVMTPVYKEEVANKLACRQEIGLAWCPDPEDGSKARCSIRSAPQGPDVGYLARKLGGNGHKHAAGFKIPIGILNPAASKIS